MELKDLVPAKDIKAGSPLGSSGFGFIPEEGKVHHINTNTYISVGVMIVLLGGFGLVVNRINDTKSDMIKITTDLSTQAYKASTDTSARFDRLEGRMNNYESSKNSWSATSMFKWAVHLQQSNPQIKVPEPEVDTK